MGLLAVRRLLVLLVAFGVLVAAVWIVRAERASWAATPAADGRPRVVVTTGMIADLVRAVGGDRVDVVQLIVSGVDPHLYSPTRRDILSLESADVIIHNGFLLEGRLGESIARASSAARPAYAVAERVVVAGYPPLTDDGATDPHLWMDVAAWAAAAESVREILVATAPQHEELFRDRGADTVRTLIALDDAVRSAVASIPEPRRVLVTAHDAFGYFGRAYGIEVHGIQGISTESEAGVRRITELTDMLVRRRVPAVFVESTVADRNVRALTEAVAARGHRVALGGELFSDAMGADGTPEGTYLGMIVHNVATIVRALGGQLPDAAPFSPSKSTEKTPGAAGIGAPVDAR